MVRLISAVLLTLVLAACNRGVQSKDAVRQGVVDHLKAKQFDTAKMNVDVTAVTFAGNKADATVSIVPKGGGGAAQGMSMQYQLEQQSGKWVVLDRKDTGAPHGGTVAAPGGMPGMPGAEPAPGVAPENPHGGKMPSPESLPPASKKK